MRAAGLPRPRLTVEPGRAIVGPSTVTLYTVGTVKDVDGLRTYVSVDGGMSDNIRTALYDAAYACALASRGSAAPPMLSRVVGQHCESGDIVVRHAYLPPIWLPATCWPSRPPAPTAGPGQQLQPRPTPRRGRGPRRRRPAGSSAARPWTTC